MTAEAKAALQQLLEAGRRAGRRGIPESSSVDEEADTSGRPTEDTRAPQKTPLRPS